MSNIFQWRNLPTEDDLSALDSYLQRVLTPVIPSDHFVRELQSRLLSESFSEEGLRKLRLVQYMFVTTGVVAGVSILLITALRVMIGFLGLLGFLQQLSKPRGP